MTETAKLRDKKIAVQWSQTAVGSCVCMDGKGVGEGREHVWVGRWGPVGVGGGELHTVTLASLTCLLVHCSLPCSRQEGKTQKFSSLLSLQSGRWSHTSVYGTRSTPFVHVKEGGSGVRAASQVEACESMNLAQHALWTSHANSFKVT